MSEAGSSKVPRDKLSATVEKPTPVRKPKAPLKPSNARPPEQFVDPSECQDFVCSLCLDVPSFADALESTCCSHFFCPNCVSSYLDSGECPLCRARLNVRQVAQENKFAQRKIMGLKMRCDSNAQGKNAEGCKWVGEWGNLASHTSMCQHIVVPCTWCRQGCQMQIKRSEHSAHVANCEFKIVACRWCRVSMLIKDLKGHESNCPEAEVPCPISPACAPVKKTMLSAHTAVCPNEQISCMYANFGCGHKCRRADMESHMKGAWTNHVQVLSKRLSTLQLSPPTPEIALQMDAIRAQLEILQRNAQSNRTPRVDMGIHVEVPGSRAGVGMDAVSTLQARRLREQEFVMKNDRTKLGPGEKWCIVDTHWVVAWRRFLEGLTDNLPGPITNSRLVDKETGTPHVKLHRGKDYRGLTQEVFNFAHGIYGGDGPILRDTLRLYVG